ncbi:tetratricopeptide repeat protein [Leisingera thetidis]|uniref:tetratricopeptide repeat protein n=1 Tax=Leisingera thetidis TaxID=2930199 RepID=UPI0021F7E318|nr:tetratricopeptide repeat protein [Leisingera thetidis]
MDRRLAAILAADVVGYARLISFDESGTLAALMAHIQELIEPKITEHKGRIVKLMGDGILAEFPSAVEAVLCAVQIQQSMVMRNREVPDDLRVIFRVGINIGDIVVEGEDIYGDGVNVASRIEGLADPGGVCVARNVFSQVNNKLNFTFDYLGEKAVKNIEEPVATYRVVIGETTEAPPKTPAREPPGRIRWRLALISAVVVLAVVIGGAVWWQAQGPDFSPARIDRMAYDLPDEPSLAVLPFSNLSNDPEQQYFADGIANDLITDLSKFKSLFVISANSTFSYKGKAVKVQQVAEELGVRYVLEGSIQRTGDTIRINVQLIDALSGYHLWAERYDRKAEDLFAIQSEILKTIAGTLQVKVTNAEFERALNRPTENLSAYDYYQRGFYHYLAWGKENNGKARRSLEKAIELDPDYARAYAQLGFLYASDWRYEWVEDTSESLDLALSNVRKAVALNPNDYWNLWALGHVHLARGESDQALSAYSQALLLNPNDPRLLMEMVELLVSIGDAGRAVAQAQEAMRYNPFYPEWYLWNLGWAQYMAGQHDEAIATLQKMVNPPNGVRRTLAAALVQVGRVDEARVMIAAYMKKRTGSDCGRYQEAQIQASSLRRQMG